MLVPTKAKRWPLGDCMLTAHVKAVVCKSCHLFDRVWGWTRGGRFGSAFGRHPLANFCATLNRQMAIMVGNPWAIFHTRPFVRIEFDCLFCVFPPEWAECGIVLSLCHCVYRTYITRPIEFCSLGQIVYYHAEPVFMLNTCAPKSRRYRRHAEGLCPMY